MRFRPTLWATLATVPALAVLIGLGVWQLDRLEWKEALIATRAERVVSPVIDMVPRRRVDWISDPGALESRLPPKSAIATIESDPAAFEYRPVRLAGNWLFDRTMHLVGRTLNGKVGEHAMTPLALAQGGTVLVDRGWVPPRGADGTPADITRPEGRVVVEGYIRLFTPPGYFTPDNEPANDLWFWPDATAMATATGRDDVVTAFYVQAGAPDKDGVYPVGSIPEVALRNPHLQYALTWFGIAGALVAVYVAFHMRRDGAAQDLE